MHFQKYLEKHKVDFTLLRSQEFHPDIIVVIPCYDEPELGKTIDSLVRAQSDGLCIEIIVVVNSGEFDSVKVIEQNRRTYVELNDLSISNAFLISPILLENVKYKHAGVGYARKIGMDLAVARYHNCKNKSGVIVSLDADTLVEQNYFQAIYSIFQENENAYGAIIRFEHHISGESYSKDVFKAISAYELHLRYVNQAFKYACFPYSHHTIGSAFAVRAWTYVKHGGMNRKKGGEDFYFLHKLFPHGEFVEVNSTCVYPSPRPSARVPFGTGPQVAEIMEQDKFLTYSFKSFIDLRSFFQCVNQFYNSRPLFSECIESFLLEIDFDIKLEEIRANTSSFSTFSKRFFTFFDAFKVLKFLNFANIHYYSKGDIYVEAEKLLCAIDENDFDKSSLLDYFRKIEGK